MQIMRIAAIVFALMNAVGLVWFIDTAKASVVVPGIIAIICALLVSIMPRRHAHDMRIKSLLIILCFVGVGALGVLIANDYNRIYGPDYGAITMRLMFAYTFLSMGIDIRDSQ